MPLMLQLPVTSVDFFYANAKTKIHIKRHTFCRTDRLLYWIFNLFLHNNPLHDNCASGGHASQMNSSLISVRSDIHAIWTQKRHCKLIRNEIV